MRLRLPASTVRPLLRKLIVAGLRAADPSDAVSRTVSRDGTRLLVGRRRYNLTRYDRVLVVGAGKASGRMAQALERILGTRLQGGLVVVKTGHVVPTRRVQVVEAGHPVPDPAGLRAAERLRSLIAPLRKNDLLLVLLSGGASSLLPAPVPHVSLSDKQHTTRLLLNSGATIREINTVRKHLSLIKGGRLAASTKATIVTLLLSDVLGDDPASIGSGPTVPDPSTYREAVVTLQRYRIWDRVPRAVRRHLLRGRRGVIPETPKPGSARFRQVQHEIVGNNLSALTAVTAAARQAGLRTVLLSTTLEGEARLVALEFAALARRIASNSDVIKPPCCIVAGGETTVTVHGKGTGGRAQEFAAAAATGIVGLPNVWIAAFGTDGTDGPTDAAGAVVSGSTLAAAARRGLDVHRALRLHDTYPLLKALKAHIVTGPTGTNVNDLYLLLVL